MSGAPRSPRRAHPSRRVRVLVRGHVQGVGFRMATRRRADALGLGGGVRNLSDGRVECVAEGPAEDVADLLRFLAVGPPGAAVAEVDVTDERPIGGRGFEVAPDAASGSLGGIWP